MFPNLPVHHQGVHSLMLYKKVTEQYFDLLHMWNTWWASSVKNFKTYILL